MSELSAGSVFAERYRVERQLAVGGMGAVYEVVHIETNRRRALKVLHAKFIQSEIILYRFRQEARVAAEIECEHIVDIFDAGIDATTNMPFLVMELLRGEDLRARIRRDGALPVDEVVRCLYETCLALEKTHEANIVHRDLKPDNLFLCEREHGPPRVKVLDFGIAKIVAEDATETQLTQSLGTPLYMAPEQFSMNSSVSPATDIFALGLIAYTMLVGKAYWSVESTAARSPIAFALHASRGPQISPVERAALRNIHLPPAFDAWFFRATALEPADRFPSAMSAIVELAEVLDSPLPHESKRGKNGPSSASGKTQSPPAAYPENHEADQAVRNGPHSVGPHSGSLLSVRTIGASGVTTVPPQSRHHGWSSIAGVAAILAAGPLFDTMVNITRYQSTVTASSSSTMIAVTASTEPSHVSSTNALPSASSVTPPTVPITESPSVTPTASAMSSVTAPTKSPEGRPSGMANKPANRGIWKND